MERGLSKKSPQLSQISNPSTTLGLSIADSPNYHLTSVDNTIEISIESTSDLQRFSLPFEPYDIGQDLDDDAMGNTNTVQLNSGKQFVEDISIPGHIKPLFNKPFFTNIPDLESNYVPDTEPIQTVNDTEDFHPTPNPQGPEHNIPQESQYEIITTEMSEIDADDCDLDQKLNEFHQQTQAIFKPITQKSQYLFSSAVYQEQNRFLDIQDGLKSGVQFRKSSDQDELEDYEKQLKKLSAKNIKLLIKRTQLRNLLAKKAKQGGKQSCERNFGEESNITCQSQGVGRTSQGSPQSNQKQIQVQLLQKQVQELKKQFAEKKKECNGYKQRIEKSKMKLRILQTRNSSQLNKQDILSPNTIQQLKAVLMKNEETSQAYA